ncbi:MAG: SUMF1/EgtB/PvdO family nonheme iron enzyme, partial [Chloroflexales bacterium]
MTTFSSTFLGPGSPLFRGRQKEIADLRQICQEDVRAYWVIYGGHQNGKTSLLNQLEDGMRSLVHVCTINFQRIPNAPLPDVYAHIGQRISNVLPMGVPAKHIADAPTLTEFLARELQRSEVKRLVLLLDELGVLSVPTRAALAYSLRALFEDRITTPALSKLQIIFSGGIELYDLVVTEASSLHSICEEIYLEDLTRDEAVGLIADGLIAAGANHATIVGKMVYARVSGHPYLTQRMGGMLAGYVRRGSPIGPEQVEDVERQIRQGGSPLLRQIQNDLREHRLEDAARRLLTDPPRFNRLNTDMVRLELIGLAKRDGARWAPRNPLLAEVFREELDVPAPAPEPANVPTPVSAEPATDAVITAKKRRLAALELTAARYGIDCPPHITIEIEDLRREMGQFERRAAPAPASPVTPKATQPPPTPAASVKASPPSPAHGRGGQGVRVSWLPTLIPIPAGPFLMGSSDADTQAYDSEKPQHTLTLPDYWIAKTPVTNAQFQPFVEGDGYRNERYWTQVGWQWCQQERIVTPHYWDDKQWNGADYPLVGVSWFEAVAYCRWLSAQTGHEFRLPSEAEWEKAARGTDGRIYPWGNTWEVGRCNSKEAGIGKTTPVGQYPNGASPYGVLDMAGNVWEWCATKWGKPYPYQIEDEWAEAYLEQDMSRIWRGGSWYFEQKLVRGAY